MSRGWAEISFGLQLSGHTHGGQYSPFTLLIHGVQRYVAGLYRVGEMALYVHRGTIELVELSELSDLASVSALVDPLYPAVSAGDAWVAWVGDRVYINNSHENSDIAQDFSITLPGNLRSAASRRGV